MKIFKNSPSKKGCFCSSGLIQLNDDTSRALMMPPHINQLILNTHIFRGSSHTPNFSPLFKRPIPIFSPLWPPLYLIIPMLIKIILKISNIM